MAQKIQVFTTSDITCPRCGRKEATITSSNEGLISGFSTDLTHAFCGYSDSIYTVVSNIVYQNQCYYQKLEYDIHTRFLRVLLHDQGQARNPGSIVQLTKELFEIGYFKDIDINVQKLTKACCPICGGIDFSHSGKDLRCVQKHLSFHAFCFLDTFLHENFSIMEDKTQNENVFRVLRVTRNDAHRSLANFINEFFPQTAATLTYEYNYTSQENVLIVKQETESDADFSNIMKILNSNLDDHFKIIIKMAV